MTLYKSSHLGFILRFFGTATMTELESLVDELDSAGFRYGKVFDFRNYTFGSFYGTKYLHADNDEVLFVEIEADKQARTVVEIRSLDPNELGCADVEAEKARYIASDYDVYEVNRTDFLRDYKLSRIFK